MNPIVVILVIILVGGVFYLYWHAQTPSQLQSSMQRIDSQISPITGDKLEVFVNAKPIVDLTQQISNNPLIPMQFKPFSSTTLAGTDNHGNLLIKNQSNIINSSSLNPNATAYLKAHPEIFANMQNISSTGITYGSTKLGTQSLTPTSTDSIIAGETYHLSGKLSLYDKTRCSVVTQNGQSTTQCPVVIGPYQTRLIFQVVDTDPYRISYMSDKLPTARIETNPDGTFSYDWQTLTDKYYVGNYNVHFWVESETKLNGQTVTDEFDHSFTVLAP